MNIRRMALGRADPLPGEVRDYELPRPILELSLLGKFTSIETGTCSAEARAVEYSLDETLIVDSCCRSRAGKIVASRE
jgi:hypothetical protein